MTLRQEREKADRAMKSPKKKRERKAKELRKELKQSHNYTRRDHEDASNHQPSMGKTNRKEI